MVELIKDQFGLFDLHTLIPTTTLHEIKVKYS